MNWNKAIKLGKYTECITKINIIRIEVDEMKRISS